MVAPDAPTVTSPRARRLAGLDGIRGPAALYVAINHVFLRAFPGYPVDHAPFWAALAFSLAVAWLIIPQPGNGVPDAKSVLVNGVLVQYLTHAPIVAIVCERILAWRVPEGVRFFLVSQALVLPLRIGFAWGFSALFEAPFRHRRGSSAPARPLHACAEGAPA